MTKRSGKHARGKHGAVDAPRRTADYQIYVGLLLILALAAFLTWLVLGGQHLGIIILFYVTMLVGLVNVNAWRACAGRALAPWQQALARIPLRFAGYGTKEGRPLAAAHGSAAARRAVVISIVLSLVLLAGLAVVLIPGILE